MTEEDKMSMIQSKEEDAYADRKPQGIQKEGEEVAEDEEEDYAVDLSENCLTLRKTAAFTISRFACKIAYLIFFQRNIMTKYFNILNNTQKME